MNVHGGVSAGEFQVFKYAPLAARSGRYQSYDSPPDQYHRNCISTNVVLLTDPAEPDDRGDQNTRRGLKTNHATWDQWLAIRQRYNHDVAKILNWQVAADEARCRADLTAANPPRKCRKWIREFVWLADRHLIVLDFVQTANPRIKCQWQLHADTPPTIQDRQFTVVNEAPDLNWARPALKPKVRRARLVCQTLAPKNYTVIVHGDQQARSFGADGESLGPTEGNPYHRRFGKHVVQLDAGDASAGVMFLNVLTAQDADQELPPPASYRQSEPGTIELQIGRLTTHLQVP
jgi:hypothetical protein